MVKGALKQAVVVKGTGVDGFSSAVFISDSQPEEYLLSSADDFLRAARRIAGEKPRQRRGKAYFFAGFFSGALFSVLFYAICVIIK